MLQENFTVEFYDGKERQIRVILPNDYKTSGKKYPVVYMLDGQNLFDPEDSFTGSTWQVRESIESLLKENKLTPLIVVGIDHADEMRLTEYSPWDFEFNGSQIEGEGSIFSDFLITKLIPAIEARYPVATDKAGRTLAGSSMGALISVYTALKYPDTFNQYGIFSLCSWVNKPAFNDYFKQTAATPAARFFVQVGDREGYNSNTDTEDIAASAAYLKDTIEFVDHLTKRGVPKEDIAVHIGEAEWHSETSWSKYMPEFLLWIQNDQSQASRE